MDKKNNTIEKDLGLSLIDTLASSDFSGVVEDQAEVILDQILKDGLLKDIPIISTITGLVKTAIAVRDYLLVLKLLKFLQGINITEEERSRFEKSIGGDTEYRRTVGQNLLILIDKLDDITKADMVAKLFKAFLQDNITYNEFKKFASVVERIFIGDLNGFLRDWNDINGGEVYAERLYLFGLAEMTFETEAFLVDNPRIGKSLIEGSPRQRANSSSSFEPIKYKLSKEAFVLAQIITGKTLNYFDYLEDYRSRRHQRRP